MPSERAIVIPVNRRKMIGVKFFIHEEKLKHKHNQTSGSDNEIKNPKVKIKEGTGSEMLIEKDTPILNKNKTNMGNSTENNKVKVKEQQTSEFEKNNVKKLNEQQILEIGKNSAMPPPSRNARKRKRKKRVLKNSEVNECLEPIISYTENFLSEHISSKNSKIHKASSLNYSPDGIGSLTQSIYQYKNLEINNTMAKTEQTIPFSLSDDPSSASLEGVTNNLPLPLISKSNTKDNVSLGDKSSTILSNSSTESKNNKTILISSSCNSNVNNDLNVESNVSLLKPYETTVALSESSKNSDCEKKLSLNVKTLPMRLKKYTCSLPVSVENLISETKSGKLKTDAVHLSLPMINNISDASEEEYSDTDSNYLKSSPSLLENYCTAQDFTLEDDLPKPHSKTPNLSCGIIDGKEKLNLMEIPNSESKYKMNRRNDLHNTSSRPASEYTSQKIIPEENESCYVSFQSFCDINKTTSTNFFATPMKSGEVVLESDRDSNAMLVESKGTNMNLQQKILLQKDVGERVTFDETFDPIYSSTQQSSSQSLNSSYHEEYLNEESKICLGRVIKIVARHYKVPVTECIGILRSNSFNILNTMQELQSKRYTNSEQSN